MDYPLDASWLGHQGRPPLASSCPGKGDRGHDSNIKDPPCFLIGEGGGWHLSMRIRGDGGQKRHCLAVCSVEDRQRCGRGNAWTG